MGRKASIGTGARGGFTPGADVMRRSAIERESRCAWALVVLLALATMTVAATAGVSQAESGPLFALTNR